MGSLYDLIIFSLFSPVKSFTFLRISVNGTYANLSLEWNEVPKCNGMQVSQLTSDKHVHKRTLRASGNWVFCTRLSPECLGRIW